MFKKDIEYASVDHVIEVHSLMLWCDMLCMSWVCLGKLESCLRTARNKVKASLTPSSSAWLCVGQLCPDGFPVLRCFCASEDTLTAGLLHGERDTGICFIRVIKSCTTCFLKMLTSLLSVKPYWLQLS